MNASRFFSGSRFCRDAFLGLFVLASCVLLSSVSLRAYADDASSISDKIECITPDGRVTAISHFNAASTDIPASVHARDTISCELQEGQTIFIIPFPKGALVDRFTFINQNAAACGELNIAVSECHLAADSPRWVGVEGIVPFAHKRLFNLSMVGINARYVKLSFRVENTSAVSRADHHSKQQFVAPPTIAGAEAAPPATAPAEP
ncbi:MAG TPA: hypothetical protein VFO30_02745 [Chthoniobacterales bacterium]|nr:hypothetical protein [Chthoniobacterales bacterium]